MISFVKAGLSCNKCFELKLSFRLGRKTVLLYRQSSNHYTTIRQKTYKLKNYSSLWYISIFSNSISSHFSTRIICELIFWEVYKRQINNNLRLGYDSEEYLGPSQLSLMEVFAKIVNRQMPWIAFLKSSFRDVWYGTKYSRVGQIKFVEDSL